MDRPLSYLPSQSVSGISPQISPAQRGPLIHSPPRRDPARKESQTSRAPPWTLLTPRTPTSRECDSSAYFQIYTYTGKARLGLCVPSGSTTSISGARAYTLGRNHWANILPPRLIYGLFAPSVIGINDKGHLASTCVY